MSKKRKSSASSPLQIDISEKVVVCGHCGHKASPKLLFHEQLSGELDSDKWWVLDYKICKCEECGGEIVFKHLWNDADINEYTYLYPPTHEMAQGMPERVRSAYEEACAVKSRSANAYAAMLGRLLEAICDDRNAQGDDLYKQLKDLADRGEIPAKLGQLAQRLREMRNVGAHARQGELTAAHVPILDNMTRALLDYLYTVPSYLEAAEVQLNDLKQSRQSSK